METLNKKSQQIFFFCKGNGTTEFKMNPSTLLNKDCCSFRNAETTQEFCQSSKVFKIKLE